MNQTASATVRAARGRLRQWRDSHRYYHYAARWTGPGGWKITRRAGALRMKA